MHVTVDYEAVSAIIDEFLARWRSTPKRYPFNRPDAIIPQTIIPDDLRRDKRLLSNWYIAINNHMKGRVESLQAFRANILIWQKYPWFYDPHYLLWEKPSRIIEIYEEFLPTDKKMNARALFINYRHLMQYYDSSGLNLIKGMDSWDEAERRILNKRTKSAVANAGHAGQGLFGHRHKMVSMLVYFYDWEGWFKKRFPYPSPADIHNFRIGIAGKGIVVTGAGDTIGDYESISRPWRAAVMRYIIERGEDPVDVADALWLPSNVLCGNSPLTMTKDRKKKKKDKKKPEKHPVMFGRKDLPLVTDVRRYLLPKHRKALGETCLICPLRVKCDYAIPAGPYYDLGHIVLRPRPKIENFIDPSNFVEPTYEQEVPNLAFEFD